MARDNRQSSQRETGLPLPLITITEALVSIVARTPKSPNSSRGRDTCLITKHWSSTQSALRSNGEIGTLDENRNAQSLPPVGLMGSLPTTNLRRITKHNQ